MNRIEAIILRHKTLKEENPKYTELIIKNHKREHEKHRIYEHKKFKRYIKTTADPYIKMLICRKSNILRHHDIPQNLIIIHRAKLKLTRLEKQIKKGKINDTD